MSDKTVETDPEAKEPLSGVYTSLVNLVKHHGAQLAKNERVYELGLGEHTVYVVANSPGAAALKWIVAERVADKQIVKAAFEAMGVKRE